MIAQHQRHTVVLWPGAPVLSCAHTCGHLLYTRCCHTFGVLQKTALAEQRKFLCLFLLLKSSRVAGVAILFSNTSHGLPVLLLRCCSERQLILLVEEVLEVVLGPRHEPASAIFAPMNDHDEIHRGI